MCDVELSRIWEKIVKNNTAKTDEGVQWPEERFLSVGSPQAHSVRVWGSGCWSWGQVGDQ